MNPIIIYIAVAFLAGAALIWLLLGIRINRLKKELHQTDGSWQREKLMKETAQKEAKHAYDKQALIQYDYEKKIQELQKAIDIMNNDILLLQKNNEETEALLKAGKPALHELKLQLIEANNTIARYKAQLGVK